MNGEDLEMRAKVHLLKATIQTKNTLLYQINQLKIKNTYRQSNPDFRDFRDMGNLTKVLHKKLQEVKSIHSALDSPEIKKLSIDSVNRLLDIILHSEGNVEEIDDILNENLSSERYLTLVKEKYSHVMEKKNAELKKYNYNDSILSRNFPKQKSLNALEEEICDYKAEIKNFHKENQELLSKQKRMREHKRGSVDRIKIFNQLSDNALRLRSKLLFREELKKNIENAETEVDSHFVRVNKEKERLQELEADMQENIKYAFDYKNSIALKELCDNNKLELSNCRKS